MSRRRDGLHSPREGICRIFVDETRNEDATNRLVNVEIRATALMHRTCGALVVRMNDDRTVLEILCFEDASYELDNKRFEPTNVPTENLPTR